MEEVRRITKRRRRLRTVGEPHPWEPRHMRLTAMRFAESVGEPAERRNITLGLAEGRLALADAWGMSSERGVAGDLAPFAWAYRNCDFCIVTIYDKDIGALRDDLLFVAKRAGVELRWHRSAA